MYAYAKFLCAILAFDAFQATFSKPVQSTNSHSLSKRAANCDPRLGGLSFRDCRIAANQIPHTETPIQFQPSNPNRLAGLPYIWSVGECTIAADLINVQDPEYITFLDIAHAAQEVIYGCVRPLRHGGSYVTGVYDNFKVTIYQFDYGEEETVQVGPDPTGKCSVKGEVQDVETCVLAQGALSGFSGP